MEEGNEIVTPTENSSEFEDAARFLNMQDMIGPFVLSTVMTKRPIEIAGVRMWAHTVVGDMSSGQLQILARFPHVNAPEAMQTFGTLRETLTKFAAAIQAPLQAQVQAMSEEVQRLRDSHARMMAQQAEEAEQRKANDKKPAAKTRGSKPSK